MDADVPGQVGAIARALEVAEADVVVGLWALVDHFLGAGEGYALGVREQALRVYEGEVDAGSTLASVIAGRRVAMPSPQRARLLVDLGTGGRASPDGFDIAVHHRPEAPPSLVSGPATDLFCRVAARLAEAPRTPVGELALLSAEEAAASVVAGPTVPFDREATLCGLLFATARAHPDRIAVRFGDDTLTYAQLVQRVRTLAAALQGQGVGPNVCVGVNAERSLELPVALFGILAAGGAYVPLDLSLPVSRLEHMLRVTEARLTLGVPAPLSARLGVTNLDPSAGPQPSALQHATRADDLCYVIFTSGSTGRPKGVQVHHRAVVNRLHWMQRRYPLAPDDVILHKTPAVFDVSVWELFWWSQVGATMVMMSPGMERFPLAICEAIAHHGATVCHFIPSLLDPFLGHVRRTLPASQLTTLRRVFSSGEALQSGTVERFDELLGARTKLSNLYGPTEATVDVTYYDCESPVPSRIPIGRPIDNTRLHVRRFGRAVPRGAMGTLFIGGDGVARGYAGEPRLTAAVFVAEPGHPGQTMYDTGDRVRWNEDGELEFFGRIDHQVKIAGMRVELEEIEQVGLEHEEIDDCAVAVRVSDAGVALIRALLVSGASLTRVQWREHFAARLPRHMVPSQFAVVDALPRTPSGKLNRGELFAVQGSLLQ